MSSRVADGNIILEARAISKSFQSNQVLRQVDIDLEAGEVHVLFGENGAGKSTLVSILSGVLDPSDGQIFVEGNLAVFRSVDDAKKSGIYTVFQEFSLVPNLTVADNIYLGEEPHSFFFVHKKRIEADVLALFKELDFKIDVYRRVGELSRAEQQMVEIAKAVKSKAKVLILDEPTASLTNKEVRKLFALIEKLKAEGVGIIYISHRIQEFREIADRITVLRDGKKIDTYAIHSISDQELVEKMAGRKIDQIYPHIERQKEGKVLLSLQQYKAKGGVALDLEVRGGEVLGVAGLVGSGKSFVWRSMMGLHPRESGTMMLGDKTIVKQSTREMIKHRVFYLPPDRKDEGLHLQSDTLSNIGVNAFIRNKELTFFGMIKTQKKSRMVADVAHQAELKKEYFQRNASQLSGGNQQKILFSKGLISDYDVYIFDEPSVGVDVGTRSAIYRIIKDLTEMGKAVVVISSDLSEVIHLSHRVIVFNGGAMVAQLEGEDIHETTILKYFFQES